MGQLQRPCRQQRLDLFSKFGVRTKLNQRSEFQIGLVRETSQGAFNISERTTS